MRKRWLSRKVIVNGNETGLSIVEFGIDGTVAVFPFEKESAGVTYTGDTILIDTTTTPNIVTFRKSSNSEKFSPHDIG